jgi:hypothetical protein
MNGDIQNDRRAVSRDSASRSLLRFPRRSRLAGEDVVNAAGASPAGM